MFQSEEMVNQVLDYSKILVDQVEREKGVHYGLKEKSKQYLIFAGMLSYYGLDNVTVIYEAFKLMNFHISNLSVEEIIEKNYHDVSNKDLEAIKKVAKAFVTPQVLVDSNGNYKRMYDLFVSTSDHPLSLDTLVITCHEVNHIVNSVKNAFLEMNGKNYLRTGLYLLGLNGNKKNCIIEESINVLQTNEIVKEIINFSRFKIYDPVISSALENVSYAVKFPMRPMGYPDFVPIIHPIYEDDRLHHVFKQGRLNGGVSFIREEIDRKSSQGTFDELSTTLDQMFFSPSNNFYANRDKARGLVKRILM